MHQKWIAICLVSAGLALVGASAEGEQRVLSLQREDSVRSCVPVYTENGQHNECTRIASAGHASPIFSQGVGTGYPGDYNDGLGKTNTEAQRNQWVEAHSFIVYTKDEVYNKGETFARNETYDRAAVDSLVTTINATINAKLAAMKVRVDSGFKRIGAKVLKTLGGMTYGRCPVPAFVVRGA